MESKEYLEVGDSVTVLGEDAVVWDLVESNPQLIKVVMQGGIVGGDVVPVILKQVQRP